MPPLPNETQPAETVLRLMRESSFVRGISEAQHGAPRRALTSSEINALKLLHNAAEDWTRILVPEDFNPNKVVGCYFAGDIVLGSFKERVEIEPGVLIGSGCFNSDLSNVTIGDNAFVSNNTIIANCTIGSHAIVEGCGSIVCTGRTTFGNGQRISFGLESGGRETAIFAELTVDLAARIASFRSDRKLIEAYEMAVEQYTRAVASRVSIIEPRAIVKNTPRIVNCFIGSGAVVDSATTLENTTILSNVAEPARACSGVCIRDSLLQWGTVAETHALVQNSVLCEHSGVESHGKVRQSLIGPNSHVGCGECINTLMGPFVSFHHQSILISAFWPEGKGNIGYGANIGSNHTSKAPDQEIWPGEGTFFGLGVNIKFPTDFTKAPYSIIATGVSTLPQRCEMPFSLINVRADSIEGISPAFNEILPAWVLSDNIYAVLRNERKYAIRNKATRNTLDYEVFRPEIIDMMVKARDALDASVGMLPPDRAHARTSGGASIGPVYIDKDIPGLGKNFMKETARLEGIKAYSFYIRLYALKGLRFALHFCFEKDRDHQRVLEPGFIADPRSAHELALLHKEFPNQTPAEMLQELVVMSGKMVEDIAVSKEKDDFRGARIIPDYTTAHIPAAQDAFVVTAHKDHSELKTEIEGFLKRL